MEENNLVKLSDESELLKLIEKLEENPGRSVKAGDVAKLMRESLRVWEAFILQAMQSMAAVVAEGFDTSERTHLDNLKKVGEAILTYADSKIDEKILELKSTTWN